ncbi:hypothetical protein J7E25_07725 [Agromyces sp. ISL-38]|uniref:WcbI family polysaccharide biosynthesis putative acetyltransferase n=1 Tax=Agromyces sp. ISL-38 TaxID=2819107 RepID=UPI001BE683CC|nr:WcbI family polysaccharide biosynthesis putative acetyltransferase [Agromyces sp. ISL-38]MBT2498983.1 hypothetical protein [Agromyces sp. ISL-38]
MTVYGNCQAAAMSSMLRSSPAFTDEFNVVWLPGAHELVRSDLPALRRILARTSVFITQNIRDNYRSMPIGTSQLRSFLPRSARTLTYPVMYYKGLHPYLVYVHATGDLGTPAPRTEGYHDLRFISAAGHGMDAVDAAAWMQEFGGAHDWIRETATASLTELRKREESLDVHVSGSIEVAAERAFWTVNHPSNAILATAIEAVHAALGVDVRPSDVQRELLSYTVVPVSNHVRRALGAPDSATSEWVVNYETVPEHELLSAHLEYYRSRPEVLKHALTEHSEVLAASGLFSVVQAKTVP